MDVNGIVILALIGLALWAAVKMYQQHGVSWELILAPVGILMTALLFLWLLNNYGLGPMRAQAQGVTAQLQDVLHEAVPDLVEKPEGEVGSSNLFGKEDQISQPASIDAPQPDPPKEGDLRWGGDSMPSYGGMELSQIACLGTNTQLVSHLVRGYLPSGVQVTMTKTKGAIQAENQIWLVTVGFPTDLPDLAFSINGLIRKQIKSGIGGDAVIGQDPWPLVQERLEGEKWVVTSNPPTCQFP